MDVASVKAVIFDLGGVMVRDIMEKDNDTIAGWFGVPTDVYVKARRANWQPYELGKIDGPGFFSRIADDLMVEIDPEDLFSRTYGLITVDKDMVSLVKSLHSKGLKTAILSNNSKEWSKYELEGLGLKKVFDLHVFSCDVHMRKPDKEIFDLCAKKLRLSPGECVFVDDKERNTKAASSYGFKVVTFRQIDGLKEKLSALGIRL